MSTPSVASSAASNISVVFEGRAQTLEEALDACMMGIGQRLTDLHMAMRHLASLTEQEIDEVSDFKESVEFEHRATDLVRNMVRLLEEIPPMAHEITGKPPAECKDWYSNLVTQRKAKLVTELADYKAATAQAKASLKARQKTEAAEAKTGR